MKRNIFAELTEGVGALAGARTGKVTIRSQNVDMNQLPAVTAGEVVKFREHLHLSRPIFPMYLRTKPNAQATAVIRQVQKYPETVVHLTALA